MLVRSVFTQRLIVLEELSVSKSIVSLSQEKNKILKNQIKNYYE